MRGSRRTVLLLTTTVALLGLLAAPGAAEGHHPDDAGHGGPTDHRVHPGERIQAVIDEAQPGDTIVVLPGEYAENLEITTDGITLIGHGVNLVPPAEPRPTACDFPEEGYEEGEGEEAYEEPPEGEAPPEGEPEGPFVNGICVAGEVTFPEDPEGEPEVARRVTDVTIRGFTVTGFSANGILTLATKDSRILHNHTVDNAEYGIFELFKLGGVIKGNRASGSEVAGIYVGDSPDSGATVAYNHTYDNALFGFFLRDAGGAHLHHNRSNDNCVGVLFLDTGSGNARDWHAEHNLVQHNTALCPGVEEEAQPTFTGTGVLILSASAITLERNAVLDNVPSGDSPYSGGIVVATLPPDEFGEYPTPDDNVVRRNVALGNEPVDLLWDQTGTGNVFEANVCETSDPEGLCD